jgi:hypothetical protein
MNPLVATQITRSSNRKAFRCRVAAASAALLCLAAEAFAAATGSVAFAWNANAETNIAGYRLQYGTTSGVYPNSLDVGKVTTATATGLNPGDTYHFVVVAYNTAGQTSPPSAQVSYTVPGTPNTAPTATAGSLTVLEDGQATLTLSGSDPEGDFLSFSVVTGPTKGTLTGTPPNLTYKPNANANGSDSFTFRSNDGFLNSANATFSIAITPVNDVPVATPRTITTNEDTSVAATLSGTDVDGNPLSYTVMSNPTKGTLTGTPPNLTYVPNANANGSDSFTFRVSDGTANSANATVTINITPVNDAPVASGRTASTNEDTAVLITLSASDVENSPLTYAIVGQPANGTLSGTPPSVTYTPKANFNGSDSFTFRANDGTANSANATVNITVTAVNDPPVANALSVSTVRETAVAIKLAGSDVDNNPLTFAVVTQPANGTLSGTPPNLSYLPKAGYTGGDSFTYRANDGTANSANATVTLNVTASANRAPVANNRTASTAEDTAVAITLTATDADSNPLTYAIVGQPANGTLSGNPPSVTYTPKANFNGSDSFTFRANDGTANSANATVSITVTAVNDPPVANALTVSTPRETAIAIKLTGSDVDNNPLTFAVVTPPANGTLSGTPPNLSYLPKAGYTGGDSFTYRANDGTANSANATVTLNVTVPSNQAPVAVSKSVAVMKGKSVPITLSATDAEGSPLTYSIINPPASEAGVLTGTPPKVSFKPATGFTGNASFAYRANDGSLNSAPAWVSIRVKAGNVKPVATGKSVTVNWNRATVIPLTGTDADSDPLTFTVVKQPVNGTLSGTPPNVSYTPNTGFRGKDSFTFTANDGLVGSAAAIVDITVVNPNNRAPVAVARNLSGPVKAPVTVTLAATDADADPITYRVVTRPVGGKLLGKAPNLIFRPGKKFTGVASFTYVANDGAVDSAPATVTITITAPAQVATRSAARLKAVAEPGVLPTLSLGTDPARPGMLQFAVSGQPGEIYTLEASPDLSGWSDEREVTLDESGGAAFEMAIPADSPRGFFRLRTP